MKIEYLTPEDQLLLDPYGNCRNKIGEYPQTGIRFEKPSPFYRITPDECRDRLRVIEDQVRSKRHAPYFEYMDEMWSKWGPQGGVFGRDKMMEMLQNYYDRAQNSRSILETLRLGRDYLLRRIKQVIADYGYPQAVPVPIYDTYAAVPTGMHKGDFLAEVTGMKPYRHMLPTMLGQRIMRNALRLIFMDSVNNVRYVERELTAVRNWLKTHFPEYFGAWLNPSVYVNPMFTDALAHRDAFVESDYIKMDQGLSLQIVSELILPIYETLIPDSYLSFAAAIEEMYHQPVYCGDFLVTGLHNTFSGQPPTNDFETIYTVILALGTALKLRCMPLIRLAANGDDVTVAIRHSSDTLPRKFLDHLIEVSDAADMKIHHDEKSRIVRGETRFCRKVYYPAGFKKDGVLVGAYPLNLAVNNVIQPERPCKTPGLAAAADLSRLDNCEGVPGWVETVQMLLKFSTHKFLEIDPSQLDKDWWLRLYGESWNPACSPSLRIMQVYQPKKST